MYCIIRTLSSDRLVFRCFSTSRFLSLTATETSTALRPFYFVVHPDRFGQHPQAREVNEDSLKRLSEYLQNLHTRKNAMPQSLLFYVKESADNQSEGLDHFRAVRIALLSLSTKETVSSVLRACNLPLDYVNSIGTFQNVNRPVLWNEEYRRARDNIPNMDNETPPPKSLETLRGWLDRHLKSAKEKQRIHFPIVEQAEELRLKLMKETGLKDIRWTCGWGTKPFRACLRGFSRIYNSNKHKLDLTDYILNFGNETGVCVRGNVILRHDDVPDNWLPLLRSVPRHTVIRHKLPAAEKCLSAWLADINVIPPQNTVVLAETYLQELRLMNSYRRLSRAVRYYTASQPDHVLHYGSLSDIQLVVDCVQGSLHISPSGAILVPSSCPVFLLIDFINKHAEECRKKAKSYKSQRDVVKKFITQVQQSLELAELTCDTNITCDQLQDSLERLLVDPEICDINLTGCRVKIAQFYSVMSDGEMYIPWNWQGLEKSYSVF